MPRVDFSKVNGTRDLSPLPAGQYVLSAWLLLPTGQRLFDEYEFTYDGTGAPPHRP